MIHFLQFFFAQPGHHWYEAAVYGNVVAILPCGLIAFFYARSKHEALQQAHRAHNKKLKLILEHLDPEAETDGLLDLIADRTDETTPGGIGAVLTALDSKGR